MALDISKFIHRFIDEAREQLRIMEEGFEQMRGGSADAELVNRLFRAAHTIKGSSRMLKLLPISDTAHSLEDVLSALREEKIRLGESDLDVLFETLDNLGSLTEHLASQPDPASLPAKPEELCLRLAGIAAGQPATSLPASSAEESPEPDQPAVTRTDNLLRSNDSVRLKLDSLEQLISLMSEVTISQAGLRELLDDARRLLLDWEASPAQQGTGAPLLDRYQQLYQGLRDLTGQQESLIQNLHEQSLNLRMLPLAQIFEPARKLVRELGRELGKPVDLDVHGEEIELDRQLIEQLTEPVQHLLRNSLDHGLENPQRRAAAGKSPRGRIRIGASQDGNRVRLDISDDGAGLDVEKIRQRALRLQLFGEKELEQKGQDEIKHLIFMPGFSTSAMITDLSGRGVGLDVVRRSVEELQGSVTVSSQAGKGTCFSLYLPMSLALMRILLVRVDGHHLAFSAQHVVEMIHVPTAEMMDAGGRRVFVLRNEFIPVFEAAQLMQLPAGPAGTRNATDSQLLLVLQVRHEKIALRIDQMVDERDLVIKPLPQHLVHQPLVAGIVNHGYRQLVSLLHVPHLIELARHSSQRPTEPVTTDAFRQHVLVVDDSLNTREIEKDLLEAWGYQVTLAEDGLDGLEKALAGDFDAILTDVEMPVMDGFTLTGRLREEERYRERPIIIITSREKESDRRRGIEVGADAYIVKGSFDQRNLVDTLKILLG